MRLLLVLLLPAGLPAAGAPLSSLLDPLPGQVGSYEGSAVISQTLGSSPASEVEIDAAFSYLVFAGGTDGERRLLLVRSVAPRAHGLPMPPYSDAGFFWVSKRLELVPIDDPDPSPHLRVLEMQLPSAIFPSYELPEADQGAREEEVRLVGSARAKIPMKVSVARDGSTVTVTRTLEPGAAPKVDLEGSPSTVEAWTEVHVFDASKRIFKELRRELRIAGKRGEHDLRLGMKSSFQAKEVRALDEAEKGRAALVDKEVGAILEEFRGKKHPRDIYQRIQSLAEGDAAKLLAGLGDALLSKLSFYRQGRDRDLAGSASTGVVGKEAPDFTLEGLEGKKVSFREATKGKVVLLNFWGYG